VIYSYNINQRDALISLIYFWNRTLHVSARVSVHHQESGTVYTTIGICHTGFVDSLLASSQQNLYDIHLSLCIQYQTPDDGQKTWPKHVEFYSKNKFEKSVHLVGFIIRACSYIRNSHTSADKAVRRLRCYVIPIRPIIVPQSFHKKKTP
jgi:hypothetical protein